jgi:sterol 3beta-glucosyltransferase
MRNHPTPSNEEKLAAIQEEFGDIAGLMENQDGSPSEPEKLLANTHGSLFK